MPKLQEIVSVPQGPPRLQHGVASPEGATVSGDSAVGCPTFRLAPSALSEELLVRGSFSAPLLSPISPPQKTKRPGACARPVNPKLVAGVRFELTTFGL
jgi:hypothetical protein